MRWIIKKTPLRESGAYNINILYNEDIFYIMDNHLAAAWCWAQKIDVQKKYGLFHIDRHFDLCEQSKNFVQQNKEILVSSDFMQYKNLKNNNSNFALRFDNYIDTFNLLYPDLIQKAYFATHKDGVDWEETSLKNINPISIEIWDLLECIENEILYSPQIDRWIINIDLDYFFTSHTDNQHLRLLSNKYIETLCDKMQKVSDRIDVVTIAISPEFCGNWNYAFPVLDIFNRKFSLHFKRP